MQIEFAFGVKSAFSLDTNALNDYFTLFIKICKYVDGRIASICVTEILLVVLYNTRNRAEGHEIFKK